MGNNIINWQPLIAEVIPHTIKTPAKMIDFALQLNTKDKKQIVDAFKFHHYEMGLNYLWGKTTTALKKELATVGICLLGEMLGKTDVDETDDVQDILTEKDAIKLAEELGAISSTDAMRLRHVHELINHFSQLEDDDGSSIEESEALNSLKVCIKSVLGRPKVEVAKKFVDFREALDKSTLAVEDPQITMLKSSPYFFYKLTISVLMNAAKNNIGANLEHALANINTIVPILWEDLRDAEKWKIGHTYAEVYADGKSTAVKGIKEALLKVKGFDYVPENLRSDSFIKVAQAIIKAHDGLNNFYNEVAPVKNLSKLGTTIPTPALSICFTALLSVYLGNRYGTSWEAKTIANEILSKMTIDRWQYYINHVLVSDTKILNKLKEDKPCQNWLILSSKMDFKKKIEIKDIEIRKLISTTSEKQLKKSANSILMSYYGE